MLPCRWCSARAKRQITLGEIAAATATLARQACRAHSWLSYCSIFPRGRAPHGEVLPPNLLLGGRTMVKLMAVLVVLASFLLVGPVIESGTTESRRSSRPSVRGRERRGGLGEGGRETRHRSVADWDRDRCPVGTKGGFAPLCSLPASVAGPRSLVRSLAPAAGQERRRGSPLCPRSTPTARQRSRHARSARISDTYGRSVGGADLRRAGSV